MIVQNMSSWQSVYVYFQDFDIDTYEKIICRLSEESVYSLQPDLSIYV